MQTKAVFLGFLLSLIIPMISFSDSTQVVPTTAVTPGKPQSYVLGIGTFLGLFDDTSSSKQWFLLTRIISNANPSSNWQPTQVGSDMCATGYYPIISYDLAKGSTAGKNNPSAGIDAALCFRVSSNQIQVYPMNLVNKVTTSGVSNSYAAVNFTITCMRCPAGSTCNIVFPQSYDQSRLNPSTCNCNKNPPSC